MKICGFRFSVVGGDEGLGFCLTKACDMFNERFYKTSLLVSLPLEYYPQLLVHPIVGTILACIFILSLQFRC